MFSSRIVIQRPRVGQRWRLGNPPIDGVRKAIVEIRPESQSVLTYHEPMVKFFLWLILLVLCWPLALLALVIYPIAWLFLLPFRLAGIVVSGALELIWAIVMLPALVLRKLKSGH